MSDAIPRDNEFERILREAGGPPMKPNLWCHFCQKDNHSDDTCWSTRPTGWKPVDKRLCVCSGTPQALKILGIECAFCGGLGFFK